MAKDRIPTSRVARTARVSGLAAGQAARHLGTRAANLGRSEDGRQAALERRNLEAAEQIVAALGTMKGAAMKLGQVMSFLDVGLVPEEHREEFQRKLGELRDAAPKVRFTDMRKVIESDLDESLEEAFDVFDTEPIAAASIGQVYRARLHDGRDVAVKVQYPGVAQAVRADMQNLGIILRLMKRIAPGLDVKSTAEEIRARIGDELDYELEAQHQRTLARIFRGHPFIRVPEVVTSLSRERVLVSEYVTGLGFDAIKELDQATRDRVGEIIFRFFFGCMYRHRQFSGDPHPGNFLLQPDGSVAFLDFGLFKVMPAELIEIELECQRAGHEGDAERLHEIFSKTGFLRQPERFRPDKLLAQFLDATWWYVLDEEMHLKPEIATEVMIEMSDPRSSHFGQMRHETLPADHLFGRRVELLTLAVLSQLEAHGELAPDRARVDVQGAAGDRPRPLGSGLLRLLNLQEARGAGLPGREAGGDADAVALLHPAELDRARDGGHDQLLGDLVAAHRGRLHAPHQPAAADGLAPGRQRVDRHGRPVGGDQPRRAAAQASAPRAPRGRARAPPGRRCTRACRRGRGGRAARASRSSRGTAA